MLGIEHFYVFIVTGLLLNLYPGQDTFYILARGISQGRMAGIAAALGISTGALFHTSLGAIGISAIIVSSANAFLMLKVAGALYLFYQAVVMLKHSCQSIHLSTQAVPNQSLLKVFKQGAITNILNPKVALFFMALLPQFISPYSQNKPLSFIILGLVFVVNSTIWCVLLAYFSAFLTTRLRDNPSILSWVLRANAALFIYLGIKLALFQLEDGIDR